MMYLDILIMMFSDECVLYKSDKCCDTIKVKLQDGLNEYVEWGRNNNMHLKVSKTKAMFISPTIHYNLYRPLETKYIQLSRSTVR